MTTDTSHDHHPAEASAAREAEHHGATDGQYILIAVILALITAGEVTLTYIDVGPIFLPALLIMMAAKFITVVSFFMHLKFDHRVFSVLFYMGLFLAVGVYCGALLTFHFFAG